MSIYLSIPNYPDPQAPGQTFTAYAAIRSLQADFFDNQGQFTLAIYRTQEAMKAGVQPAAVISIIAGGSSIQPLRPNRPIKPLFPDLATIQTVNADHWTAIWQYLLTQALTLDELTGATIQQG